MNACPVTPMMHAMLNGACCESRSERVNSIPARQEFPVESAHSAFIHAFI